MHLRKSCITILGSAFHIMGIRGIVKYMIDNDGHDEWQKLVGMSGDKYGY